MKIHRLLIAASLLAGAAACEVTVKDGDASQADSNQTGAASPIQPQPQLAQDQANPLAASRARELALTFGSEQQRAQARQRALAELKDLRFEVDISEREVRVFNGDKLTATHQASVGTSEWPTPTGSWEFHRVDLNPEWNPPISEEWAKKEEKKAPGDPENPMGRARLVYRMPNTVHGTDDLASLGKASSHGSIRVANDVAIQLAELLLKAGDAWAGPEWFQRMTQNRTEEYQIDLNRRIPIKVQE